MGVFKDLAIQELNQETSGAELCSVCGGINQTASNFCFACVTKYGGQTCAYCGVAVNASEAQKCHAECSTVYCQKHWKAGFEGGIK